MLNPTLSAFDYAKNLIHEYEHWSVLLRKTQVTLGSLVIIEKSEQTRFSDLNREAFTELHTVYSDVERVLYRCFPVKRINYLALMMVDPNAHYHVIPRYSEDIEFDQGVFSDINYPKPPDLLSELVLSENQTSALKKVLINEWKR